MNPGTGFSRQDRDYVDYRQNNAELLKNCRNAAELRSCIADLCADTGQLLNLTLLCGKQSPGQIMCVVDFVPGNSNISVCAMTLGGRIFGFNSVVFNFTPPADFTCLHGFPPAATSCSCTPRR